MQHTRESLRKEVHELADMGVPAVILFGLPPPRTPRAARPGTPTGIVQVALRDLRADMGDDLVLMADLCLDEYTDHGHCGVLDAGAGSTTTPPSTCTRRWRSPRPRPGPTSSRPAG